VSIAIAGAILAPGVLLADDPPAEAWRQWGGPNRNFIVEATGLAEKWPDGGPPILWSRPLGTGHSAILADEGRLFTMYRVGNGRAKQGPWEAEEIVIALDARTGETIWEYRYPSKLEDFNFGAGPHSTPIVVGDRLSRRDQQAASRLRQANGNVLWSHDLVKEFNAPTLLIRPVVKAGYGCSPLAFRDTILCSVGGPGSSHGLPASDGTAAWKSGDFLTSEAAPILIELAGKQQLVVFGGGTVQGMDPPRGRCSGPIRTTPGTISTAGRRSGARTHTLPVFGVQGGKPGESPEAEETDAPRGALVQHPGAVHVPQLLRIGDTSTAPRDFGPAFLTALDVKTGETLWQHRGFGRRASSRREEDHHLDEDGDPALATLTPERVTILSKPRSSTTSWTVPTLVGTTLYARDREDRGARPGSAVAMVLFESSRSRATGPGCIRDLETGPGAKSRLCRARLAGPDWGGGAGGIHITQAANGTLVIESEINESHARIYKPGGTSSTPVAQTSAITMASRWEARTLTSEGNLVPPSGAPTRVKEAIALSDDGRTLTVGITASGPGGTNASTLVYTRTKLVEPCEKWSTPCKTPGN
jgi:outer membrane protein assembly factor BamB